MISALWDIHGYLFWLLVVSFGCLIAERLRPWRVGQKLLRRHFLQDLFWLFFNGHWFALVFAHLTVSLAQWMAPALAHVRSLNLFASQPDAVQFAVYFVLKDFLEWCVHNVLHRVPALWEIHKLHHSITEMDWIGNFRFHWLETVVYQGLTYVPLVMLGVNSTVLLLVAIANTILGHLNHSNLDLTWGPLRYVFNSSRMHIWHHAAEMPPGRATGVNFGLSLSVWDWLSGTAHWPSRDAAPTQQPAALGFQGIAQFPQTLTRRFLHPFAQLWRRFKGRTAA